MKTEFHLSLSSGSSSGAPRVLLDVQKDAPALLIDASCFPKIDPDFRADAVEPGETYVPALEPALIGVFIRRSNNFHSEAQ
ncbi:hypothetical protein [Mesorhizobium sp.]|uniref:hypothetical protein n=1 Tax=Mesorhizobium sp. TaxID=1871066 RepID=UPI0025BCFE86|nr:hypothetical protein [Mesorhizobium sp.]